MSEENKIYRFVPEAINNCKPEERAKIFANTMNRLLYWADKFDASQKENELLKSKLEKSKEKLQSILDEKWILLKADQDRLLNKVSEVLKEIEGLE